MPVLQTLELPIDSIEVTEQIRKQFDEAEEIGMAESVAAVGMLQPIRVCAVGNGRYRLLFGERRLRTARRAGITTLPAIVEPKELTRAEILQRQLIENIHRQDLNPLEKSLAIEALMKASGKNASQIAKTIGIDPPTITKLLSLRSAPEAIQHAVRDGRVALTSAYELSREPDAGKRKTMEAKLLDGELTREAIVRARRTPTAATATSERSRLTFRLDAERQVQLAGPGLTSAAVLIDWLEDLLGRLRKSKSIKPATLARLLKEQAALPAT